MDTIKEYWRMWLWRDAVTKIITINFIIWLVLAAVTLFLPYSTANTLVSLLILPASYFGLAARPLTLLTYMFTQIDFLHMLCNMLWLMLFGDLLMHAQGSRRMVTLYIYGGIASALAFLAINSHHGGMCGASSAVLALVGAAAILVPNWKANLFIFGPVKIIWLVVAAVIFFVILGDNFEQTVAHAVGFAVGIAYGLLKKRNIDITQPVIDALNALSRRHRLTAKPMTKKSGGYTSKEEQEFDDLLAKVGRSGYGSLSAYERQRLFTLSQKIKR